MPNESQTSSAPSAVAEFDDNAYRYNIFGREIHYRTMAILCISVAFTTICITFGVAMSTFAPTKNQNSIDSLATTGFFVFFVSGTFSHFFALVSIKRRDISLLAPSVIFHGFLVIIEVIMLLTSIGELVTDKVPHLDENEILAKKMLCFTPFLLLFNSIVLYVLIRFRYYLKHFYESAAPNGEFTFDYPTDINFEEFARTKPIVPVFFGNKQEEAVESAQTGEEKPPIA